MTGRREEIHLDLGDGAEERVWAVAQDDGTWVIESIPLFARHVTRGDRVAVVTRRCELHYAGTVAESENSLLRVVCLYGSEPDAIRDALRGLGCEAQLEGVTDLIAVSVPPAVPLGPIQTLLGELRRAGRVDYEAPILRRRPS